MSKVDGFSAMNMGNAFSTRALAVLVHLTLSAMVALFAAYLVFAVWYPYPYSHISGGLELFGILVGVDVAAGPLVTAIVFAPTKSSRQRVMDMVIVVILQIGALAYGVWTMSQARPVQLVYEDGQFGVAHAVEVDPVLIQGDMSPSEVYPISGPGLQSLRPFKDSEEQAQATLIALGGVPLAARLDLWQPYQVAIPDVLEKSQPLSKLRGRYPAQQSLIENAVRQAGVDDMQLRYVPMVARGQFWTVLVHAHTGMPAAFIPLDSF